MAETEYEKAKRVYEGYEIDKNGEKKKIAGSKQSVNVSEIIKLEDELKKYQKENEWMKNDPGMKEKYDREIQTIEANINRNKQILTGELKSAMESAQKLKDAILPYIKGTDTNAEVNRMLNEKKIGEIDQKIEELEIERQDLEASMPAVMKKNEDNAEERKKIDSELKKLYESNAYKNIPNTEQEKDDRDKVLAEIAELMGKRKSIKDIKNSKTERIEEIKKEKEGLRDEKERLKKDNEFYEKDDEGKYSKRQELLEEYKSIDKDMEAYRTIAKNMDITLEKTTPESTQTTPVSTPTTPMSTPTTPVSTPTTPMSTPTTPVSTPTTPMSTPTTPVSTPTTPMSTPTTPVSTPTKPLPKKQSRIGKLWANSRIGKLWTNIRNWVEKVTKKNSTKSNPTTPEPEKKTENNFKKAIHFDNKKAEAEAIKQCNEAARKIEELFEGKSEDEKNEIKKELAKKTTSELQHDYKINYAAASRLFSESNINAWRKEFREKSMESIYEMEKDEDGRLHHKYTDLNTGKEIPIIKEEKKETLSKLSVEEIQREYFLTKAEAKDIYNDKGVREKRAEMGEPEKLDNENVK